MGVHGVGGKGPGLSNEGAPGFGLEQESHLAVPTDCVSRHEGDRHGEREVKWVGLVEDGGLMISMSEDLVRVWQENLEVVWHLGGGGRAGEDRVELHMCERREDVGTESSFKRPRLGLVVGV